MNWLMIRREPPTHLSSLTQINTLSPHFSSLFSSFLRPIKWRKGMTLSLFFSRQTLLKHTAPPATRLIPWYVPPARNSLYFPRSTIRTEVFVCVLRRKDTSSEVVESSKEIRKQYAGKPSLVKKSGRNREDSEYFFSFFFAKLMWAK